MRRQWVTLIMAVGLVASACGASEVQSAGIAESPVEAGSGGGVPAEGAEPDPGLVVADDAEAQSGADGDASESAPAAADQLVPGIDNAELAEQLLLDDSDLEGDWTATVLPSDPANDALVEESLQTLTECNGTLEAFGPEVFTADSFGEQPAALVESPTYESPNDDSVDFSVEIYLDPDVPAENFRIFEEVNLEVCLSLVLEALYVELFREQPQVTVLPISTRRVRAPAGNDDVFAIEFIAPLEVEGSDNVEARIATFFLSRSGVVLSATIGHTGDIEVEAVLLAMHDRLDEVLDQ